MALAPGTRIGIYEISALLGAGGMGEVYRARDPRLERDVALKILPPAFAADADRVARFEREARTLAALNHPHIAQVFGFEQTSDTLALAMEFVPGADLSERLARGPLPVEEAVAAARQIADALDAAHAAGIVHRDLKPANIKLRDDGTVKVLDFGLAKAIEPAAGIVDQSPGAVANFPTITTPAVTRAGVILGTAAYMSPEQARGKFVDKRTDLWAFGCVLYEMLTAQRAFNGETVTDVLSAIVRAEPDWSALPADTPPSVTRLLRRCLAKDARVRQQSAGDARLDLDEALEGREERVPAATGRAPAAQTRRARALAIAAASALAAAALTLTFARGNGSSLAAPVLRYTIDLPRAAAGAGPAVSPDGRHVAVSGRDGNGNLQIWLRALDETDFRLVPAVTGHSPFWSPDGAHLGYFSGGKLMRVGIPSGAPREIATVETILDRAMRLTSVPASWGHDDAILLPALDGVYAVSASGGELRRVTSTADSGSGVRPTSYSWPQWGPGQAGFFYTALLTAVPTEGMLLFQRVGSTPPTQLLATRSRAHVTPHGVIVARATGPALATLSAHRFDEESGRLEEPGHMLANDASLEFGASDTGVLVYRKGSQIADYNFDWVDDRGRSLGEGFDAMGPGPFNLSRDGALVAYNAAGSILLRDFARGVTTRIVQGPSVVEPVLSPDGQRIAYTAIASGRISILVTGTAGGTPDVVHEGQQVTLVEDWSHDGRYLAANQDGRLGLIIPLDRSQPPTTYADLPAGSGLDETRFSPDGRWLVYNAADSGRQEVYLIPLPPTGERWQLSLDGGAQGRWRQDGKVVFYLAGSGDLMAVDVETSGSGRPRIGRPRALFNTGLAMSPNIDQYAPNANGTRFLLRRPQAADDTAQLNVIVNWPSLVSRQ